ncbi:family 5 glycoside hydrolase [Phakopsora pachyrhizi]|uniref:Family 5 glycoside hydrolase n=1 Tax=Phakopsora pachyrhizi TaxID=170000 RepID=A0AAV0ALN9_PHAPC|nr:family 5 glycoside hydrolase [Phakopsora pachyrhizi]
MKDGQPDDDFNHSSSDHQRISPSIRISGRHLIDPRTGETIQLRGFSVSSHSKLPSITSESKAAEASDSQITFVGNPLRLDEADHYLNQITSWGYNLIRLVVCWESIEHSGPGQYDLDYINYLVRLVEICQTHQLRVIVDCHQDVWSRFSGGSGAPGWTLELVGFRLDSLVETRSAVLYDKPDLDSPNLGLWPTGYQKLASATMFTLFFGGDTFAPDRKLSRKLHAVWAEDSSGFDQELISVQRFLQDCICEAFGKLADALARFDCVIGFEPMNEPHRGFIDLHSPYRWNPITDLHLQDCPSFLQSVALADGHPQRVDIYKRFWPTPSIKTGKRLFRPRRRAWKDSMDCIWKEHGVWEWDEVKGEARMLKKDYFKVDPKTGQKFDFYERSLFEFVCKFSERVQKLRPDWLISFGPVPNELYPKWEIDKRPKNLIAGPHFYDLFSLFHKSFGFLTLDVQAICSTNAFWKWFYFGHSGANKNYAGQIGRIVESVYKNLGEVPILIGETGVCMDMNGGRSFKDGNFYWQEAQMDSILSGIEKHLISFVVWNFDPYNDNEFGDHWNGENFSLISRSKIKKSCKGSLNCHLLDNRTEELKEEGGFSEPRILKSIRVIII